MQSDWHVTYVCTLTCVKCDVSVSEFTGVVFPPSLQLNWQFTPKIQKSTKNLEENDLDQEVYKFSAKTIETTNFAANVIWGFYAYPRHLNQEIILQLHFEFTPRTRFQEASIIWDITLHFTMEQGLDHWADIVIIVLYFAFVLGVGLWVGDPIINLG